MLCFLFQDPELVKKVTEELQSAFNPDGTLDIPSLQTQTTYLTALFHETLRVANSSASARFVTQDTRIGQCVLRKGRRLLIPYRQLHLNKAVFGHNASEFDISRFLNDKTLAQNTSFRPFGGGQTYCPGRYLAKQEIFMAMAYLLCRNDVQLVPTNPRAEVQKGPSRYQKMPRMDELKPGIGIIGAVPGDDLILRLTPKEDAELRFR
jgi:cytochrome P450